MRSFCLILLWLVTSSVAAANAAELRRQYTFHVSRQHHSSPIPASTYEPVLCRNTCIYSAYHALQAWKRAITHDPKNITGSWVGGEVCNYKGVICAAPPDHNPTCDLVVAAIDLNGADLAGTLPQELSGLNYLAFFHLNSNRFCGTVPASITTWRYLYELDLSNNLLSGYLPKVLLQLPSLVYLDIRFNNFVGPIPEELFSKPGLDAVFLNNNKLSGCLPQSVARSSASVAVFASNKLSGEIPHLNSSLEEVIFLDNTFTGCLPQKLPDLTVLDVSFNHLSGALPECVTQMKSLQQLDVAHNLFSGEIPAGICALPALRNFTASYNYFSGEGDTCVKAPGKSGDVFDDRENCIPGRPMQRSPQECEAFFHTHQACPAPKSLSPPPVPPKCECDGVSPSPAYPAGHGL